jgi:hypothetical protein
VRFRAVGVEAAQTVYRRAAKRVAEVE